MSDYQQSYAAAPPQTHTLAIVSLIFGILGVTGMCAGVGPIVALITGNMARRDIQADPARYTGDGLAKAGVIMGWIGVAFTVLALCAVIAYFVFVGLIIGTQGFEGSLWSAPDLAWLIRAALG